MVSRRARGLASGRAGQEDGDDCALLEYWPGVHVAAEAGVASSIFLNCLACRTCVRYHTCSFFSRARYLRPCSKCPKDTLAFI